jgi:uncharacterized protein (TIGR02001 family)
MRKSLITVAVLGALSASSFVFAAEKEAKSDFTTSGSVGFFSQYIFRGLTQTDRDPAFKVILILITPVVYILVCGDQILVG